MKKEKNFAGSKGSNNKIEGYIEKVIKMDSKADTPASVSTPVQQQDGVLYVPTGTLPGSVSDPSTRHELLDAVEVGDVEHLQQLLSTGLDTNAICDDKGRWPLHIAASKGSTEMVSLLLEHGSLADQPDTLGGRTALHLAAASATDTVEVLLQNGATVNVRNKFGYNPLHFAAAAGQAGCCRLLAESNCDVTARDKESLTPLHVASRAGDVWCVEVLLEYGADPGIPDRTGKTPLHHAAESVAILGTDESRAALTIDRLISLGANVNSIDSEGKTALFYAASYGSVDCIKTLLELGAEISDAVTLLNLAKTQPRFVRPFLDKCLKSNLDTYDVDSKNFYVQFDYTPLTFYPQGIQEWKLLQLQNRRDNESFLPEMGVLHGLIKCRDTSILVHPLCESFLRLKWKKIRWFFYFDLFLYALFLAFLTIVIFFSMDASKPMGQEYQFEDIPGNRTSHNATKRMTHYSCLQTTSSAALWAILWALSVILLLREMYHMKLSVENYFKNFNNILKLVLIFTISMLSIAECDDGVLGMWKAREHLAAICLLIGWWVEVVMYGQIPLFSPYMRMFSKIGWDIIKCLVTFIGLVIGFGLTFHHLFKNLKDFQDVGFALLKTLGMLMSELQLQSIFVENDPMVPYTSHIIVILFLLCLSVILMNLLIGLATSGVINMHHEENYMQMRQEIQILTHWEHVLKSRSYLYPTLRARDLKSLFHRKGIIYPNHKDYGRLAHNSIDIVTRMHAMKGKIVMETSATDMVEELLKKLKGKLDKYLLEVERKGGRIMTNLDKYKKSVTALEETVEGVTKNIKQLQDKLTQLNTCLTEMGWPNSNPET